LRHQECEIIPVFMQISGVQFRFAGHWGAFAFDQGASVITARAMCM
jgi:hypothetical protein